MVQTTYSTLSQAAAVSQIVSSISSLLNGVQLPASVTAGLEDLQNLIPQGTDKAALVANVVIASATQASAMTNSRTEANAEAFLESLVVTSVAVGAASTKAVLVLILVEAAVHLSIPLGNWFDTLNDQLTGVLLC